MTKTNQEILAELIELCRIQKFLEFYELIDFLHQKIQKNNQNNHNYSLYRRYFEYISEHSYFFNILLKSKKRCFLKQNNAKTQPQTQAKPQNIRAFNTQKDKQ